MQTTNPALGSIVRSVRKRKHLSQRALAELLHCDHTYISKIETNGCDYPPKEDFLRDVAIVLEIDEAALLQAAGRWSSEVEQALLELWKEHGEKLFHIIELELKHYQSS